MEQSAQSPDGETEVSEPIIDLVKKSAEPEDDGRLDPDRFKVDQSELDAPVAKTILTALPIRRPDRLEFVRTHSDPDFRKGPVPFINLKSNREYYLVEPEVRPLLRPGEYSYGTIFLATNRLDKPFFWIVTTQSPTGLVSDWYTSHLECADRAMHEWVQVMADRDAGVYTVAVAEELLDKPHWPEQSFKELFKIGFKRRIVDSLEHPVIKQLRGRN
jgi:hypothetical protein